MENIAKITYARGWRTLLRSPTGYVRRGWRTLLRSPTGYVRGWRTLLRSPMSEGGEHCKDHLCQRVENIAKITYVRRGWRTLLRSPMSEGGEHC